MNLVAEQVGGRRHTAGAAALVVRCALLVVSLAMVVVGVLLLGSTTTVSYGVGNVDQASCRSTLTAPVGGGTSEPRNLYTELVLRPSAATELWSADNAQCVRQVRMAFAAGAMLVVGGIALFLLRRRLPGRVKDLRAEDEAALGPTRARKCRGFTRPMLVVICFEVILAGGLVVTAASKPASQVSETVARLPSPLPRTLVVVRERLERMGYHVTSISPYAQNFFGVAPTAPVQAYVNLGRRKGTGLVVLYYAQIGSDDTLAAAQDASLTWAKRSLVSTTLAGNGWYTSRPYRYPSLQRDEIGWHHGTNEIFIIERVTPIATPTITSQALLGRLSAG